VAGQVGRQAADPPIEKGLQNFRVARGVVAVPVDEDSRAFDGVGGGEFEMLELTGADRIGRRHEQSGSDDGLQEIGDEDCILSPVLLPEGKLKVHQHPLQNVV
jgi:hypothetical protein